MARISIVAAIGRNREIGHGNELLWHIPEDLKRFKHITLGHPVILGRKTFESIVSYLGKPLPGRTNIVITRDPSYTYEGAVVVHSLEEALEKAASIDPVEIFIGGGANLWGQALPRVDRLYLTLIDDEKEGDAFFPPYEADFTKKIFEQQGEQSNGLKYTWVDLERK